MTQDDLGALINTSGVSISRYEKEDQRLTLPLMRRIANALECSIAELAEERPLLAGAGVPSTIEDGTLLFGGGHYTPVPAYDQKVSAGPGSVAQNGHPSYHMFFREGWLRTLTQSPSATLAVVEVSGDSMEPTLHNGDHVLVDRSVRRVGREGIYVIRYAAGDELRIKRCTRMARTRLLTIHSDNASYQVEEGVSDDDIEVVGRVIWLGRNVGG